MKTFILVSIFALVSITPSVFGIAQRRSTAFDPSGTYINASGIYEVGEFNTLNLTKNGSKYTGEITVPQLNVINVNSPKLRRYKFIRASVTPARLSVTTQTISGVHYNFDGAFRGRRDDLTIDGVLIEFRSGKEFKKTRLILSLQPQGE